MARGTKRLVLFVVLAGAVAFVFLLVGRDGSAGGEVAPAPELGSKAETVEVALEQTAEAQVEQRAAAPVDASEAATAPAPEIERGERDLLVRVIGPDGAALDGVPLALFMEDSAGGLTMDRSGMRVSGRGSEFQLISDDGEPAPDPALRGVAVWEVRRCDSLGNLWQALEGGVLNEVPKLVVAVVAPPDRAAAVRAERVVLDVTNWPEGGYELHVSPVTVAMIAPLRVEVFFASGEPAADIPIALFGVPMNPGFGNMGEFARATTGPDGVAHVARSSQLALGAFLGAMGSDETMKLEDMFEFHVAPTLPLARAPRTNVEAILEPNQTVRVDLPPVGRLRMRFVDFRGEAYGSDEHGVQYRVNWTAAAQPPKNRASNEIFGTLVNASTVDAGWVGLDMEFNARAWPADSGAPTASFRRLGPLVAGEEVEFLFELGKPYTRLEWQVLDEQGEPVAGELLHRFVRELRDATDKRRRTKRHWVRVDSDEAGRIRWIMRSALDPLERWYELRRTVDGVETFATVKLPASAPEVPFSDDSPLVPVAQMGTLQLGPDPLPVLEQALEDTLHLYASGHVFDDAGKPLRSISLSAYAVEGREYLARARTDEAGRFELRAKGSQPFTLSLWHDDYVAATSDALEPGSKGLAFTLQSAGRIRCRIEGINEVRGDSVRMRVTADGLRRKDSDSRPRDVRGIVPGLVTVTLYGNATGYEFATFEDVLIEAGRTTDDPRLMDIELASIARGHWFRFERPDGELLTERSVHLDVAGHGTASIRLKGRSRRWLLLPPGAERAVFSAEGYGRAEVDLGTEEVVVRFAGGG